MSSQNKADYYYVTPDCLIKYTFAGKEFFMEHVNTFIATLQCFKQSICLFAEKNEMDNLRHCLTKLRSGMAELNVRPLNKIIDKLSLNIDKSVDPEEFNSDLKEFLLLCDLLESDLLCLLQHEI